MTGEPSPLFPPSKPARATPEPAPAFPPAARPIQTPAAQVHDPRPAFVSAAQAPNPVLGFADQRLADVNDERRRAIRALCVGLASIPQDQIRQVSEFGMQAQAKVSEISEELLGIVQASPASLLSHLSAIKSLIESFSGADLLNGSLGTMLLRRMLPVSEQMAAAALAVAKHADAVGQMMPALADLGRRIDGLADWEAAARQNLEDHSRAAGIVLLYAREAGFAPRWISALEDQTNALRMTVMVGATDAPQIEALREQTTKLASAARHISGDLIALWRRQCASALSLLQARSAENLGDRERAARGLDSARSRLIGAIEVALNQKAIGAR